MQIELHRLERKYTHLRRTDWTRRRRLLGSLSEVGQQQPVLVITASREPGHYVLIDGYLRVQLLAELGCDVVEAIELAQNEPEALIFTHGLERGAVRSAIEQAWLIRELIEAHGMVQAEVAVRLSRSRSWISRRLALVRALPSNVEQAVLDGQLMPQAAMKYLVPLARANISACEQLVRNLEGNRLSVRQVGRLYAGWRAAGAREREKIIAEPLRFLEVEAVLVEPDPGQERERELLNQLGALSGLCRRLRHTLSERARHEKTMPWPTVLRLAWQEAQAAFAAIVETITEVCHDA